MPGYNVISKGVYEYPQADNAVPAVNYLFINEDGVKYLLLNFMNNRRSVLTGLDLEVTQLDGKGNELGVKAVKYGNLRAKPQKQFVLTHKIPVDGKCTDFKVKVVSAIYGAYSHSVRNGVEQVDYIPPVSEKFDVGKVIDKMRWESSSVSVRTVKRRVLIGLLATALVALVLVFTYLQLVRFKNEQLTFIYGGVEYAFDDGDNSDTSNISAVGVSGKTADIVIPEKIERHRVTQIAQGAFAGNTYLRNVTVESGIPVGKEAFKGCINLESVSIDRVTEIGEYAFAGCEKLVSLNAYNLDSVGGYAFSQCTALESVNISNDKKTLQLGGYVFNGCTALNYAEIAQTVSYPEENTVFRGSNNITTLKLKNFNTIGKSSIRSLVSAFGSGVNYGASMKLQTLVIDELDYICENFAAQTPLRSFTVNSLANSDIGESAFYNCGSLTEFAIPEKAESVGDYAFCGTALTEFDGSALTYAGNYSFYGTALQSFDGTKLSYVGDYSFAESALQSFATVGNTVCNYLGKGAFSGCRNLVTFEVPLNIRQIQETAFEGCVSLQGITFAGSSVAGIGARAFAKCAKLSEFGFPSSITTVGDGSFEGCTSLSTLTVPSTVSSIGFGAFAGCTGLNSLTLSFIGGKANENVYLGYIFGATNLYNTASKMPSSLKTVTLTSGTRVYDGSFYGCSNIETVILPDELNHIGASAFEGCSSLKSVNITRNLQTIGVNAFNGCASFTSFEVPSSVVSVGSGAFGNCSGLKSLTVPFIGANENSQYSYLGYIFGANSYTNSSDYVPASLTSVTVTDIDTVPVSAFYNCENIVNIVLPENLLYVGDNAFYNCRSLKEINLPETLQYIGNNAFSQCVSIRKLIIPQNVTFISENVFQGCFRLYEIWNLSRLTVTAPSAIKIYSSLAEEMEKITVNGFTFALSASDNLNYLIDYPSNITDLKLPSPFEYIIAGYLFYQDVSLTSVEIPSEVTQIREFVFYDCTELTKVTFGDNSELSEIGVGAFYNCSSLQYVIIPAGVKSVQNFTFAGCASLVSVTVPSSVSSIGQHAFFGCKSLREISLPDGVTVIGNSAFSGCSSLQSVLLPKTLGYIDSEAFYGCVKLRLVYNYSPLQITAGSYDFGRAGYNALVIVTADDEADCAEYVLEKGINFLRYYDSWTAVWAEEGTAQIILEEFTYNGKSVNSFNVLPYAFADNSQITSVKIGGAVADLGEFAFYNNSSLRKVTFDGASITEIKPYTFSVCTGLQSVTISGDIARIGDYAFAECGMLASLTLPSQLKEIGAGAFRNCGSVTAVNLPYGLNKIEGYAFIGCASLYAVTIPSSVTSVGTYAFANCTSLVSLVLNEGLSEIGSYAFASTAVSSVEIPSTVINLDGYAFYYCSMLSSLKISEGVTTIGVYAFSNCTNLREISFASTITEIGEFAFAYCSRLENLNLPSALKEISSYSFVYNSNLKSVKIPESVTKIGEYAFTFNSSLESVVLPEGLREIAYGAFMHCGSLSEVTVSSTVEKISESAFYGCDRLFVVYNFGSLDIRERSESFGCIAQNAVKVFTSYEEKAYFYSDGSFEFVLLDGEWYLFKNYVADSVIYLTEKFFYNGSEVNGYTVREYAFENSDAEGVVVPLSVKKIQSGAFIKNYFNVYFAGDADGWAQVGASELPSVKVYYYVNCVHGEGQWTYDGRGQVNTYIDYYSFTLEITKAPTCVEDGIQVATCIHCGFTRTFTLQKTGIHEYEWETTKEPTCVEEGISTGTCIHCRDTVTVPIEKTGVHEYEWSVTVEPACTHEGVETGTCAHCGDTVTRPIDKIPHNFVDGECTECGEKSSGNGN